MYRMYNPITKRIILSRDIKWAEFKKIYPKENMDFSVKYNSTDMVPGIDEINVNIENGPKNDEKNTTELREIHVDKNGQIEKSEKLKENEPKVKNEPNWLNRELRRLETSYNPTMKMEEAKDVNEGNVIVTGNSTAVPIEMPKEEIINYCEEVHNTVVNLDVGAPNFFYDVINPRRGKMYIGSIKLLCLGN